MTPTPLTNCCHLRRRRRPRHALTCCSRRRRPCPCPTVGRRPRARGSGRPRAGRAKAATGRRRRRATRGRRGAAGSSGAPPDAARGSGRRELEIEQPGRRGRLRPRGAPFTPSPPRAEGPIPGTMTAVAPRGCR